MGNKSSKKLKNYQPIIPVADQTHFSIVQWMGSLFTWNKFYVIGLPQDDPIVLGIQKSIGNYLKSDSENSSNNVHLELKEPLVTKIKAKEQTAESHLGDMKLRLIWNSIIQIRPSPKNSKTIFRTPHLD